MTIVAAQVPPDVVSATDLESLDGRRVRMAGWPAADDITGPRPGRGKPTEDGRWHTAYDLEDGLVEAMVPGAVVQRLLRSRGGVPRSGTLLGGTVRRDGGHVRLDVETLEALDIGTEVAVGAA